MSDFDERPESSCVDDDDDLNSSVCESSVSQQSYFGSRIIDKETLEPRGRFTLYKIHMNNGTRGWTIYRRYTDFLLLNKKLRKLFPNIRLTLPGRRYFLDNFDPDFISKRQKGLEEFMSNVLYHRDVCQSVPVQKFFRMDRPPEPHESLEASQNYCQSLEGTLASYRQNLKDKEADIRSLKTELARAQYYQYEGQGFKNHQEEHIGRIEQTTKELEQQLQFAQQEASNAKQELLNLREEICAERAAVQATRETEHQREEIQYREHMVQFTSEQDEVDQRLGSLLSAFSELPNVCVSVAGRNFEVKADEGIGEHAKNLRQGLGEARKQLETLHKQGLEMFQREVQGLRANLVAAEFQVQARSGEAESLKRELAHLQQQYRNDVEVRDKYITELQKELSDLKTYTSNTEEKYFYALVIGVKLNMAICGHRIANINKLQPNVLFDGVRNNGIDIEHWPSWVSRELATASLPTNETPPGD